MRLLRLPAGPQAWLVLMSRIGHGVISLVFLSCIAVVYLGAWRGRADTVTLAAVGALCVEGALVLLSGGNCPLGPLLRRLGDDTPFFELLLPPRAAKLAVPILAAVSVVGAVLLAIRTL
jgi:hypothetical protein